MKFLYTSSDIPAGTELTLSYWSSLYPLSERKEHADGYCVACHCSLCKYQEQIEQKTKVAEMFVNKLKKGKIFTNVEFSRMLDTLKKVYRFECHTAIPLLQYHETHTAMISDDTTQEQLLSYLSATANMYETFVSLMLRGAQFQHAAHYRAECYMIGVYAKVPVRMLLTWALEIAILCMFDKSGEIEERVKTAWMNEAKQCLKKFYHSQDDRVWEVLMAPIVKDINKLAR
jgi:hypothetical protein